MNQCQCRKAITGQRRQTRPSANQSRDAPALLLACLAAELTRLLLRLGAGPARLALEALDAVAHLLTASCAPSRSSLAPSRSSRTPWRTDSLNLLVALRLLPRIPKRTTASRQQLLRVRRTNRELESIVRPLHLQTLASPTSVRGCAVLRPYGSNASESGAKIALRYALVEMPWPFLMADFE